MEQTLSSNDDQIEPYDVTKGMKFEQVGYVNFARQSTVRSSKGQLIGAWSSSFTGACSTSLPGYIEEGAIISGPSDVGQCSATHERIVKVVSS